MKAYRIALLMVGALFAACTNEEIVEEPQQNEAAKVVKFTATLAPKDGASTRAITDKNGTTTWMNYEQIAIYYETDEGYATATAEVTGVNDGVATITATLANAKNNGEANFVYPASLHNGKGGIDEDKLLNEQNGLLNTGLVNISNNFDAATGKGRISVSVNTATINGNIGMKNEVCICKITLNFADENGISGSGYTAGKTLNIYVGDGHKYTITSAFQDEYAVGGTTPVYLPFKTNDVIYVAMLPVTSQPLIFTSTNSNTGKTYATYVIGSLEAGKFYRNVDVTMKMRTKFDLRNGSITAGNGSIITSGGVQTANTITIPDGATVMLYDVNIYASGSSGIICQGTATIVFAGTNTVIGHGGAGIEAGPSGTLTIFGSGSLTARGNDGSAGIGSGNNGTCGDITIMGGTITARGPSGAAGIGSGNNGTCGDINITGGTIEARGGAQAAGIGSGNNGTCGIINITRDVTRVTAYRGAAAPYCIGLGDGYSSCGIIFIGDKDYYNGSEFIGNAEQKLSKASFTYKP